jgi:hypothetical protein
MILAPAEITLARNAIAKAIDLRTGGEGREKDAMCRVLDLSNLGNAPAGQLVKPAKFKREQA